MIFTHLVFFQFFTGAGTAGDFVIPSGVYSRIHQGVGLALSPGPRQTY